jgi:phospholipid transport system transporter-binding protein
VSDFELRDLGDGRFVLSGELSFANADRILQAGAVAFRDHDDVEVDLSEVGRADSAGLALLLEWKAGARRRKNSIRYSGIPDGLLAIARTTDVDTLL